MSLIGTNDSINRNIMHNNIVWIYLVGYFCRPDCVAYFADDGPRKRRVLLEAYVAFFFNKRRNFLSTTLVTIPDIPYILARPVLCSAVTCYMPYIILSLKIKQSSVATEGAFLLRSQRLLKYLHWIKIYLSFFSRAPYLYL